jgi:hypothetical protein
MSAQLREALRGAADDTDHPFTRTPEDVLVAARRGQRRRRVRAWAVPSGAVLAVAATTAAVLVAPGLLGGEAVRGSDPAPGTVTGSAPPPATQTSPAPSVSWPPGTTSSPSYVPDILTTAEVLVRCRAQADRDFGVGQAFDLLDPPRELRAGRGVQTTDAKGHHGLCEIPYATPSRIVRGPLATVDDHAAVAAQCSEVAGYDLTGWRVRTAFAANGALAAVLSSDNGWDAACVLTPQAWEPRGVPFQEVRIYQSGLPWTGASTYEVALNGEYRSTATPGTKAGSMFYGAATLRDEGGVATRAARVKVRLDTGQTATFPVVDGRYAIVISGPRTAGGLQNGTYTVMASDGTVLRRGNLHV